MTSMTRPVPISEARKLLEESERIKAETAAQRPRVNWLNRQLAQILAENHLSERIRHALGD